MKTFNDVTVASHFRSGYYRHNVPRLFRSRRTVQLPMWPALFHVVY